MSDPPITRPDVHGSTRRHLGPAAFARVDAEYLAAADRVDAWLGQWRGEHRDPRRPPGAVVTLDELGTGILIGWLWDTQLGPVTDPVHALITLRATQAALLRHAILLRWEPGALGTDPPTHRPGCRVT